jgi:bacillithiol synthase
MEVSHLPYKQTGFFSSLVADYLDEHANTTPLYSFPFSLSGLDQAIEYRKNKPVNRAALVSVLEKQYAAGYTQAGQLTAENIKLLADENTFTIVTGHQLCLFTGPLYFIYKLIDTITLARKLKAEHPHYNFVPVYWMHTEDNDIEEINHAYLYNKKLHWGNAGQGNAGSLPTNTLSPVLAELEAILGNSPEAVELMALVNDSYLKHGNLADATRHFVNALLGQYGLVILDPDAPELKQAFVPVVKEELATFASHTYVSQTNEVLAKAGYNVQVNPRELNLFYVNNGVRYRLVKTEKGFATANNEFEYTLDELSKLADGKPEVFSPNVVLRPLYQEVILPNICYVGGGGELAYWLQYKSFFNHYGYELPVLALRSSYMLIDAAQSTRIEKFGFSDAELFLPTDALIKQYIQRNTGAELSFGAERTEAESLFKKLADKTTLNDTTLVGSIDAEHKKFQNFLVGLEAKLLKAQKNKDEVTVNQIRKLKESLFPEGTLQERYSNVLPYYLKLGSSFFDGLINNANVLSKQFTLLRIK